MNKYYDYSRVTAMRDEIVAVKIKERTRMNFKLTMYRKNYNIYKLALSLCNDCSCCNAPDPCDMCVSEAASAYEKASSKVFQRGLYLNNVPQKRKNEEESE